MMVWQKRRCRRPSCGRGAPPTATARREALCGPGCSLSPATSRLDLARARSARPARTGREVEHTQEAKDTTEESLRSWEMEEALRQIGPHHRHAIVETYYRDRPCAEVAAEAGVPVGTMRSRLYYGLKALRMVLEDREWTG